MFYWICQLLLMFHCALFNNNTYFIYLIWKNQLFIWEFEVEFAPQSLKASFIITSLLAHVNPFKPFILEMNVSNFVLGDMFSQFKKMIFILLAFVFKKFLLLILIIRFKTKKTLGHFECFGIITSFI